MKRAAKESDKSKFDGVFKAVGKEIAQPEPTLADQASGVKRGRPAAKRSDPNFTQVSALIRKETYHAVKLKLFQQGKDREFSELVETLLNQWLKSN
jgi:hypothetical protein